MTDILERGEKVFFLRLKLEGEKHLFSVILPKAHFWGKSFFHNAHFTLKVV
jgi:hypothetical protein